MTFDKIHNQKIKVLSYAVVAITAVVFLFSFLSPTVAMADDGVLSLTYDNGRYVLDWSEYTPSQEIDGYAIEVNGTLTRLDGYNLTNFDLTGLLATPGRYTITLYVNSKGVLTAIGSVVEKVVASLDKVKNLRLAGIFLAWDGVQNADGYFVFANNVYLGYTDTTSFDLSSKVQSSGQYRFAVVPFCASEYYTTPHPTYLIQSIKTTSKVDLHVYATSYMGQIILSWQGLEGVEFFYSIDGEELISATANSIVLSLDDGEHTFELFGEDSLSFYVFGSTSLLIEDGEVRYA